MSKQEKWVVQIGKDKDQDRRVQRIKIQNKDGRKRNNSQWIIIQMEE